jgi:multiple sugar transport system ATP-binding protein
VASVDLEGLTKRYGDLVAVNDVDLHVRDQELIVLVGPSGCGKTTTLRLIAGLEEPTAGRILIGGHAVLHRSPRDRNIAMVFQNYALYPHMNVYRNMAFGLKMRKVSRVEVDQRIRKAAAILEIEPLLFRKPAGLSGGQRQRVALGRAIVRDPEAFLFDEPLSNLDAMLRASMRSRLAKLHERLGTTTIYVTHDQNEAMMIGERVAVMREGRIQQVGSPLEVYESPANRFVAQFIGGLPMNLLPGRLVEKERSLHIDFDGFSLELPPGRRQRCAPYVGKMILFGVRPEDIIGAEPIQRRGDWRAVPATVVESRPLGAEVVVELTRDAHVFVARMDAACPLERRQDTTVHFNVAKCHLFDPETENAI